MKDLIELKNKETGITEYYESNDYDLETGRIDIYYFDVSHYDIKVTHIEEPVEEETEENEEPIDNEGEDIIE